MSKCVILVPFFDKIEYATDTSLRILESRGYEVWRTPGYAAIDQGRNRMSYDALYRRGFDELFWIDGDIAFQPDDVEKIRDRGQDICCAAYPFKGWPRMTVHTFQGQKIVFDALHGGLVEVMCAATGFLYTKAEVYYKTQEALNLPLCNTAFEAPQVPFFKPEVWNINGDLCYLGEDFSFCMRARSAGYKVMLDTSIKIGHIGRYIYEWEDYVRKTGQVKPNCTQFSYQSTPTEDPDPCDDPSEEADLNLPPIGSSFSVCAKNPVTSGKA